MTLSCKRATASNMVSFTDAARLPQDPSTDPICPRSPTEQNLNEPQLQAVTFGRGPLVVFAGAGSGKTRVIVYRIAQLIALRNVAPYHILAVTFTNKAAREMRSRIEYLVGHSIASDLWMGTFHATCARLLRHYHDEVGLERNFVIYDTSDQLALMNRMVTSLELDPRQFPPKWLLYQVHQYKHEGLEPCQISTTNSIDRQLQTCYAEYQQALRKANAVDFDDLIMLVTNLAENTRSPVSQQLRQRFHYVLVDEFQDVNAIQYRLIRALCSHHQNVCVVGDDDQSIYRWRGADVRIIRGFQQDFPNATVVKLEQNYRSSGNIVRTALAVIKPSTERQPKKLFTYNDNGQPVQLMKVRDERDEAYQVARIVKKALQQGVAAQQIAVFYRIHAQSRVLEEALRTSNIAYQIVGGMRFFDRAEVKDLLAYLRVITNPKSDVDLLRIINVPARRIGASTVSKLIDCANCMKISLFDVITRQLAQVHLSRSAFARVQLFAELMKRLQQQAKHDPPVKVAESVLDLTNYITSLKEQNCAEADARLNNLQELLGSIREYEQQTHALNETPRLIDYLEQVSLVSDTDQQKDIPAISLMTIHAAKGLEFDCVIVTGFEQELLPYRSINEQTPFNHQDQHAIEEERRLAYVAFTRARKQLTILHAQNRMIFGRYRFCEPSCFLQDLPINCLNCSTSSSVVTTYHTPSHIVEVHPEHVHSSPSNNMLAQVRSASECAVSNPSTGTFVEIDNPCPFPSTEPVGPGSRVVHARYGYGRVVSMDPHRIPPIAVVDFAQEGTRTIVLKFLQPVD